MPRRKILTTRQFNELFSLPTDQTRLIQFYTLDDGDIELISQKRRDENRLGFALQLCALRYPGRLLDAGETIPQNVLDFIGAQIGISADALAGYAARRQTRQEHLEEIRNIYGFQMFSGQVAKEMRDWTFAHAITPASIEILLRDFVAECRARKIILPAFSTIERLCADAMVAVERKIEKRITRQITSENRIKLDTLLSEQLDARLSRFIWLRQFEVGNNSADMNRLLDRLEFIQALGFDRRIIDDIPPHHIVRLRKHGERYFTGDLIELSEARRLAILVVCVIEWQSSIADTIIETHDRICGRTWREAQRACAEKLEDNKQVIDQTLKGLSDYGENLICARKNQQSLENAVYWEAFETLIETAKSLVSATGSDPIHFVVQGYHRFRRYSPRMLELLDIKATPVAQDLMNALEAIRAGNDMERSLSFLKRGSKWRAEIKARNDNHLWEVAVLFQMREAFKSRELWLEDSKQYQELTQILVPMPAVQTAPKIAAPDDPKDWLDIQRATLNSDFSVLSRAARKSKISGGSIENGTLKIERLKANLPDGADDLIIDLYKRLPEIRITDIMLEVDRDIGFTDAFRNLRTGAPCKDRVGLMNVLLSEGINMGLSKMAEASNSHEYWQLLRIATWHLDETAFDRALSMVIEAQSKLPMAKFWGSGDTASSDGQFFASARQGEAMNLINARYGNTPGLKAYSHVSDQFGPFATQNIPATASEAPYILDGLLMNPAGRKIKEQYADTGGVNDMIFATTHLLGYNFIPRIRDLPSRKLYAFEPTKVHHALRPLVGGKIREQLITENWNDILRLVATMSLGVQKPSQLLKAIASFPRQSQLAFALREVGRIIRTRFIIQWLLDPEMQRRAQVGLNKGEAHHALKNAIRIGRQGEIRDRTAEAQHYRMAGLNLLTAIIIYWNTKHLGEAVKIRADENLKCPPELLKHTSPLGWAHILLTGEYNWPKNA